MKFRVLRHRCDVKECDVDGQKVFLHSSRGNVNVRLRNITVVTRDLGMCNSGI